MNHYELIVLFFLILSAPETFSQFYQWFIGIFIYTGIRLSELLNLKLREVDVNNKSLFIKNVEGCRGGQAGKTINCTTVVQNVEGGQAGKTINCTTVVREYLNKA